MPQFDTLTYFSQLFYVCLTFNLLYLSLCYYLLPSIAAILKVRARVLSTSGTVTNQESALSVTPSWLYSVNGLSTVLSDFRSDSLATKSEHVELMTNNASS